MLSTGLLGLPAHLSLHLVGPDQAFRGFQRRDGLIIECVIRRGQVGHAHPVRRRNLDAGGLNTPRPGPGALRFTRVDTPATRTRHGGDHRSPPSRTRRHPTCTACDTLGSSVPRNVTIRPPARRAAPAADRTPRTVGTPGTARPSLRPDRGPSVLDPRSPRPAVTAAEFPRILPQPTAPQLRAIFSDHARVRAIAIKGCL